ncbi:MAG: SusF/SusE family outer membrane protein [Bacteroidales bacterium]|nr:SusF/SusE family outer membrane protein [Bacteroidales bacterium]
MKKLFSILSAAALVLLTGSCVKEQFTTFSQVDADAPVMRSYTLGAKNLVLDYTPAVFHHDFNTKMATYHTLILSSVDGKPVEKTLGASIDATTATISISSLSKVLINLGYAEGTKPLIGLSMRASIQPNTYDSSVLSYVDSDGPIYVSGFTVSAPAGSPYLEYTDKSSWSVTGALSAYGVNWDKDLEMWSTPDGTKHVAKAVTLRANDEFKFRKDQGWTDNFGGTFAGLDTDFTVEGGGANIKIEADGVYDLWLDTEAKTALVTEAYLPYPDFTETSEWSVIGAIAAYEMDWNADIKMYTDGTTHLAMNVTIGENDEFKFRKNKAWTDNFGGTFAGLDADFAVEGNGANIKIGAAGSYDLFLDTEAKTARVVESLGAGISGIIGADEEEDDDDEPEEDIIDEAWAVIGAVNGTAWNKDFYMTAADGIWTSPVFSIEADGEFKLRFDNTWDYEDCVVGAAEEGFYAPVGTAFTGVQPGNNIKVKDAGDYYVTFNESTLEITLFSMSNRYSVIGNVNGSSWDKDFYMTESDGVWTSEELTISGEFKVRFNKSWADEDVYGLPDGAETALNTAIVAAQPGGNFKVPEEGQYTVTIVPDTKTVTIIPSKPANVWSVIGVNGDWNTDLFMTEQMPGIWVSDMLDITSAGWKIRFNCSWDVNRGGATPDAVGKFVEAVPGGDNINLTGSFKVVYNAISGTIGTLGFGVTGSIAALPAISWTNDVPMNLGEDGKWYSVPFALAEGDEIKVRFGADWGENYGGACSAADTAFEAVAGGDNIKAPAAGTYMVVYDPEGKTLTLSTGFWGLIGVGGDWEHDIFMLYDGAGKWAAYHKDISTDWKLRKSAGWDVNYGGTYVAAGEAFAGVSGGDNIKVSDLTNFSVIFDEEAATITVKQ